MTETGIGTTGLRPTGNEIAWRHFWLSNVIVDTGKPGLVAPSRRETWTRKDSLSRRLHKLRRMRAMLGSSR
jgi:hypothetical protein